MTSRTYPGLRARRCSASGRTAPAAVGKERFAPKAPQTADAEASASPIDVQVWNWAASAVFGGYGPSVRDTSLATR
jgi:hypothetical protein